jgi:hypothetical protein
MIQVSHLCACIGSPCLRHCVHGASIGATLGASAFVGAVAFFWRFLVAAESHALGALLTRSFAAYIQQQLAPETERLAEDYPERLLKLRVCAQFLGWLRFASVAPGLSDAVAQGVRSGAALRDYTAIAVGSHAAEDGLDVRAALLSAAEKGTLALVVPCATEYLRMMAYDPACRRSAYARATIGTLRALTRQWLPSTPGTKVVTAVAGLNHTRLCVVAVIEEFLAEAVWQPLPPLDDAVAQVIATTASPSTAVRLDEVAGLIDGAETDDGRATAQRCLPLFSRRLHDSIRLLSAARPLGLSELGGGGGLGSAGSHSRGFLNSPRPQGLQLDGGGSLERGTSLRKLTPIAMVHTEGDGPGGSTRAEKAQVRRPLCPFWRPFWLRFA